jgi:hypothetical protein
MRGNSFRQEARKARQRGAKISLLLLSLFVSFQVCITVFGHAHQINGALLVHSHPFTKAQHNHSEGQILTLAQLSSFVGLEPVVNLLVSQSFGCVTEIRQVFHSDFHPSCTLVLRSLRAPPVCL